MKVHTLSWVENALRTAGEIRHSELLGRGEEAWFGASIDTRSSCAGRVFFALKGDNTDGHRFARDAAAKGSPVIVVERDEKAEELRGAAIPHLLVEDSLRALQQLARAYRDTLGIRVVAITGSAGKTTTKEYIKIILKKKYRLHSNPGNYNNHIGVPLTLLETDHDNEYLVSEVAGNHTGEIGFLSRLLNPDIGVITNIGDAHIGLFGSRDEIAAAKSELFEGIDREGTAVLPGEDDFIDYLRGRAKCRVVTFGQSEGCTFRLASVAEDGDHIAFTVNGQQFSMPGVGSHNALNACAAVAVGDTCGVEGDRIREALAETEPLRGRTRIHRGRGIVLIDDSYNANPTSMRAAVDSLVRLDGKRSVAILGDMAELGVYSRDAHMELGRYVAKAGVDMLFWVGENAEIVAGGLPDDDSSMRFHSFATVAEAIPVIEAELRSGDVVLVKASRSIALDVVVDGLLARVVEEG